MLAVSSLITAVLAPLLSCLCLPTVGLALVSVGTGILAIYHINLSEARLRGLPFAAIGLVLSIPMLLISLAMAPAFVSAIMKDRDKPAGDAASADAAEKALAAAEQKIFTDNEGIAHGNSPEAKELAQKYAETMKRLRDLLFTEQKKKALSLTEGKFITYCQLKPGMCAFVVHVPSYRNFTAEAKESLAELAWQAAQDTVRGTLAEGDDVAVGLKGTLLYGSVMVGTVVAEGSPDNGLDEESKDKELLHPFFEADEAAAVPTEPEAPKEGAAPSDKID